MKELIVADSAVAVPVEVVEDVLRLFLGQVEPVVDEAPAEVLDVEPTVTIVIHRFKYARQALDATS